MPPTGASERLRPETLSCPDGRVTVPVRNTWVTPNGYAAFTTEADTRANLLRVGVDYKF